MTTEHKPTSVPRFTLAAFFTAPKPCEDALADLGIAYNKLADQVEEALALLARVQPELAPNHAEADDLRRKFGLGGSPSVLDDIAEFLNG